MQMQRWEGAAAAARQQLPRVTRPRLKIELQTRPRHFLPVRWLPAQASQPFPPWRLQAERHR